MSYIIFSIQYQSAFSISNKNKVGTFQDFFPISWSDGCSLKTPQQSFD